MEPAVAAFAAHVLDATETVVTPSPSAAAALDAAGIDHLVAPLDQVGPGEANALALVDDELSHAGEHAEGLIADAARVLRPGGLLVVAAHGALHARAAGAPNDARAYTADELAQLLGHAGFDVAGRYAPGAAARLGGDDPRFDPDADRTPGLLDAAARVGITATRYTDAADRSRAFFGSLPRKVVAAGVVCRDGQGRLLVVHDRFKQHWTIPGGVVDADEDPRAGAARETREEAGIDTEIGPLLGLFAMSWPDRLLLIYDARPIGDTDPQPLHAHEISAAQWLPVADALERLNHRTAGQVRRCLDTPGGSWHE